MTSFSNKAAEMKPNDINIGITTKKNTSESTINGKAPLYNQGRMRIRMRRTLRHQFGTKIVFRRVRVVLLRFAPVRWQP